MKSFSLSLIAGSLLAVSAAQAEDTEKFHSEVDGKKKANGTYEVETKTESVDAHGTKIKTTATDKKSEDIIGDGSKIVSESSTTTDPKGLGNKTSSDAKLIVDTDGKGNSETKYTESSVDAAKTGHKVTSTTETEVNSDGSREITAKEKVVTDPKGLGNKTVEKSETVKQLAPDGTLTGEKHKVNGEVVQNTTH